LRLARHDFINARFQQVDIYHQRLSQLVGEEEAIAFVCQVFDTTPPTTRLWESKREVEDICG
jgi:hypothetical protein